MKRFDPAKSARLDDPARFEYLSVDTVFELLDAPKDSIVVDYGTGTGAFAIPLAQRRPDLRVTAYDVEPQMLALAREKPQTHALGNLIFTGTLGSELHGRVARVLGVNVLHELDPPDLARIVALLAAGGRFVSIDWAAADRPVGPPPERVYTVEAARALLEQAGLRVRSHRSLRYHEAFVAERAG